jgi:hypothetical protein
MTHCCARIAAPLLACALLACTGQIDGVHHVGDDHNELLVLEGDDLADELVGSPVHEARAPFVRVGAIWEADRPGAIEISVSPDGSSWSDWTPIVVEHIELELELGSFVGQLELGEPMTHYRLRGTGGVAEYARIELLPTSLSDSVEGGQEGGFAAAERIGDASVHSRSDWGAAPTRCSTGLGDPYRMAIHHTETPTSDSLSPQARLRSIQSYHQNTRGWCDIGYHYLMSRDGRLWQGRPGHLLGAHSGGSNTGNIGIAVMGSHGSTPITSTQVDRLASLIRGLADDNGIAIDRQAIKGHREYKSTSCPGNALFAQLDEIVRTAAGAEANPPAPPKADTVTVVGVLYAGSDTSDRIAGATVTLDGRTTVTSSSGLWQFDGVPAGSFTVTASADGFEPRSITRSTYADTSWASFGLSPATSTGGTAVLQGVVYYSSDSSNRIPYATVQLSTGQTVTADANGFYRLTELPAGPVTVTASAAGYDANSVDRILVDGETEWGSVRLREAGGSAGVGGAGAICEPCASYDFLCCNTPDNDMYYLTSFDGGESMACGGNADGVSYYATSWVRWGCGAKLRVTNPVNGSCVVVEVADAGPANWVEDMAGGPVLDASTQVCRDLFGSSSCGWSDGRVIEVVEVPSSTPTGVAGCF